MSEVYAPVDDMINATPEQLLREVAWTRRQRNDALDRAIEQGQARGDAERRRAQAERELAKARKELREIRAVIASAMEATK